MKGFDQRSPKVNSCQNDNHMNDVDKAFNGIVDEVKNQHTESHYGLAIALSALAIIIAFSVLQFWRDNRKRSKNRSSSVQLSE